MRADEILEDDEGVDIRTETEGALPETMLLKILVRNASIRDHRILGLMSTL